MLWVEAVAKLCYSCRDLVEGNLLLTTIYLTFRRLLKQLYQMIEFITSLQNIHGWIL